MHSKFWATSICAKTEAAQPFAKFRITYIIDLLTAGHRLHHSKLNISGYKMMPPLISSSIKLR